MILLAYLAAGAVAALGYAARALSLGGAIAACVVGGTILGFGGWAWAILLGIFFVSSSALSFFKRGDTKKRSAAESFDKGGRRDAAQVLANGGVAAGLALLSYFLPSSAGVLFCAFAGSLAAATADTWATEIGVLSRHPPVGITTFKPVPPGTSGGVSWLGSVASLTGAAFLGASAAILSLTPLYNQSMSNPAHALTLLGAVVLGGVAGSLVDSLLGATVQASYYCPHCDKATERRVHTCGTLTTLAQGVLWVSNDLVNLAATLTGGVVSGLLYLVLYN